MEYFSEMEDFREMRMILSNVDMRQKLLDSGVIGRVLNDFRPCMLLLLRYGDKRITFGKRLWLAQVQTEPDMKFGYRVDAAPQIFRNGHHSRYVIVMTDADGPGGEYLHASFISSVNIVALEHDPDAPWDDLFSYEPPRTAGCMIVCSLFTVPEYRPIILPFSRENFSTRDFADTNSFGPPLTAAFFYTKPEEEEIDSNGGDDLLGKESQYIKQSEKQSIASVLPKPMGPRKIAFKSFKPEGSQPIPLPGSLENAEKYDSPTGSCGSSSYRQEENHSPTVNTAQTSSKREDADSPCKESEDESTDPRNKK